MASKPFNASDLEPSDEIKPKKTTAKPSKKATAPKKNDAAHKKEIDTLKTQIQEQKNQMLKLRADLANEHQKLLRETKKAKDFANQELLKALLPILDSLDGGLSSYQQDKDNIVALEEGLKLTLKMMTNTLKTHDVHIIDPVGEKFNPHHHEVLTTMANDKVPSGHIIQVVQKGYLLKDRVVRSARVIVAQ